MHPDTLADYMKLCLGFKPNATVVPLESVRLGPPRFPPVGVGQGEFLGGQWSEGCFLGSALL